MKMKDGMQSFYCCTDGTVLMHRASLSACGPAAHTVN